MKKLTVIAGLLAIAGFTVAGCANKETVKPEQNSPAAQTTQAQPSQQAPAVAAQAQQTAEKTIAEIQKELLMIHFDFNKYNIRPDAKTVLEGDAKVLNENPNVKVKVAGYCDDRGSVEYNLALGEKRAQAAKDYLVTLGVSGDRLSTISYGKSDPIDAQNNEKAWAMNRRAELHIAQ